MNGKVKRIIVERGFGFIQGQDGEEYFFHMSDLSSSSFESMNGASVTFEPTKTAKGNRAKNVELA